MNQVALQLKNTKENNGIVTSDYVSVKRMVLLQENILIGLNKDADQKKLVRGEFNDLAQLYKMAEVDKDAYVAQAKMLAAKFEENFSRFQEMPDHIRNAGPKAE